MSPIPVHREDIPDLPQAYRTTTNRDPVFVYDSSVGDKERIFIFASQGALQFLADSEHWYADGTFKVYPEIFFQMYTIHGLRDGRFFLLCSHFSQIKTKTLTIDYMNSYSSP